MPARNVILRLMLWSLGLAAVTGVLTVLVQSGSIMWRIIGTELCAAVACALILPCIPLIDREKTRAGGLAGMAAVVLEFILALIIIWELPRTLAGVSWEEELALTMFVIGGATLVAMPLLRLKHHIEHSIAARLGLIVVAVAACVFLIGIWRDTSYAFSESCAESGGALLAMGAIASVCLLGLRGRPRRSWRWVGVLCAAAAFALWLADIWIGSGSDPGFATFTGLLAAGAVVAYAIACQLVSLQPAQSWFRGATIASALVTAMLVELWVIADRGLILVIDDFWVERCTAAAGIVTGCGTLALAVLARLNRRVDFETDGGEITEIVVVCPRCRKKQSLHIGDAACSGCKLRISTRVEEPRCPTCDYLLIGLTSHRCPECGTEIAEAAAT